MLKFSTDVATNKGCTHRFRGVRPYFHDPRLLPPKERLASFANCCKISISVIDHWRSGSYGTDKHSETRHQFVTKIDRIARILEHSGSRKAKQAKGLCVMTSKFRQYSDVIGPTTVRRQNLSLGAC
jgi:hypothetical protein